MSNVAEELDPLDMLEQEIEELLWEKCRNDFYTYVKVAAPWILPEPFKDGKHIREICRVLQAAYDSVNDPPTPARYKKRRVMIFLPPRSMKSVLSTLFQTWVLGKAPKWTIIGASYSAPLAIDFSRTVRNIVAMEDYQKIFPGTSLSKDSRAANRWDTNAGGKYFAGGIKTGIAGRGAHIAVIDDPLSEQDAESPSDKAFVRNWYPGGLRTRLHPTFNVVIIISTRWAEDDLPGWLLEEADKSSKAEQWTVVEYPAITTNEKGEEVSYWPEWKPLEELKRLRDDPTMPPKHWHALFQQQPIPAGGNLISEDAFKWWPKAEPLPECKTFIMSADTAYSEKDKADPSVLQVWGIFDKTQIDSRGIERVSPCALLLANRKGRWGYPELLRQAHALVKKYNPDHILVENKASGQVLIPDLMRAQLPVIPYTPGKGQDKISRVVAISRFFEAGQVWLPEEEPFAEDLFIEALKFNGRASNHDDQVDAMTLALLWLRDSADLYIAQDREWESGVRRPKRKTYWSRG